MLPLYRKTFEVVGATTEQADVWCVEHATEAALADSPVFLDESEDMACDVCHQPLDA